MILTRSLPTLAASPGSARALAVRASLGADPADVSAVVASPSRQAALGAAYAALPLDATAGRPTGAAWHRGEATHLAYDAFGAEVWLQYRAVVAAGIKITVSPTDPYADASALVADVDSGRISVLSSAATGGHPYLTDATNNAFRVVHDLFGHAATGRGFDRHGEEAAYQAHASMFSVTARRALASETRGQNAQLIALGSFDGPQRVALLPVEWVTLDALAPVDACERATATVQARAFHAAHGLTETR